MRSRHLQSIISIDATPSWNTHIEPELLVEKRPPELPLKELFESSFLSLSLKENDAFMLSGERLNVITVHIGNNAPWLYAHPMHNRLPLCWVVWRGPGGTNASMRKTECSLL